MVILLYFAPVKCQKLKRWSSRKLGAVFFNVILTTIDATFFVTLMQAMINIKQQATGVVEINSSYVWSVIAVAIFAVELISVTIFLAVYHQHLDDDPRLKRRCGYIFEEKNYRGRGTIALAQPVL